MRARFVSLLILLVTLTFTTDVLATSTHLRGAPASLRPPYSHSSITRNPLTQLHTFRTATPAAASCTSPYASWMATHSSLLANLTLLSLTLPGSHDSGAYALSNVLGPVNTGSAFWDAVIDLEAKPGLPVADILMPWSLSQPVDAAGQLCMGARYLDVRAAWNGSTWCIFHGLLGVPVADVLQDVAQFVRQQTGEVVVVEVSHLQPVLGVNITADAVAQLNATIVSAFGELLYLPSTPSFTLHTISQLIAMHQRVVVSLSSDDFPSPLDQLPIVTPFTSAALFNTYADTADLAAMQRYDLLTLVAYLLPSPPSATTPLRKLSYTLTPDSDTLLDWWLPGQPKSLKELAERAGDVMSGDKSVGGWRREGLLGTGSTGGRGMIVLMDWFDTRLVDECIAVLSHNRTSASSPVATASALRRK